MGKRKMVARKKLVGLTHEADDALAVYARRFAGNENAAINYLLTGERFGPVVERWIADEMRARKMSRAEVIEMAIYASLSAARAAREK